MDIDGEELVVVGECTDVVAEKECVGDGFFDPTVTNKFSYANMVFKSKGLNGDVARVPRFIDKDTVIIVHNQIDYNMSNPLIVRLLRRSIIYKALISHESEYKKVLIEGPWTIYESYMML
ncbi:hypothetical protein GQ457_02G013740 [Hibiscus cannabinus]